MFLYPRVLKFVLSKFNKIDFYVSMFITGHLRRFSVLVLW